MTAGELAILLACIVLVIGFAALVVVLSRVLDTLRALRLELTDLRHETRPLLAELRASTDEARDAVEEARHDLDRFDRVLGSAEAISGAVASTGRVARLALSTPVIKATALATGTKRAARRLRRRQARALRNGDGGQLVVMDGGAPSSKRRSRA
ncbi:MAG: hypothetical protein ACO29A_02790 [Ilumatobacteraceae bacterium]|jgi:Sec-independent protein translocase protein TatA